MEYRLHPPSTACPIAGRITPSRSRNLRQGGGRQDRHGWTEHKRKSNRDRFKLLRPFIKTGVTIIYPDIATPVQLSGFDESVREFCKEKGIAARSVWEGPGKHQHIALDIEHNADIERAWKVRLQKRWLKHFGVLMPSDAFLWKPEIAPYEIASYLSKTRKGRNVVKGAWPWLCFNPVWEVGFRKYAQPQKRASKQIAQAGEATSYLRRALAPEKPGEKSASQYSLENEGDSPRPTGKQGANLKPRKTRGEMEKKHMESGSEHVCKMTVTIGGFQIAYHLKFGSFGANTPNMR